MHVPVSYECHEYINRSHPAPCVKALQPQTPRNFVFTMEARARDNRYSDYCVALAGQSRKSRIHKPKKNSVKSRLFTANLSIIVPWRLL